RITSAVPYTTLFRSDQLIIRLRSVLALLRTNQCGLLSVVPDLGDVWTVTFNFTTLSGIDNCRAGHNLCLNVGWIKRTVCSTELKDRKSTRLNSSHVS